MSSRASDSAPAPQTHSAVPNSPPPATGQPKLACSVGTAAKSLDTTASSGKAWVDMLSETDSDDNDAQGGAEPRVEGADEPDAEMTVTPTAATYATQTLLIHSFSGVSGTCSSSPDAERRGLPHSDLLPDIAHALPAIGFQSCSGSFARRIAVPLASPQGHKHGYAGLVCRMQSEGNCHSSDGHAASLWPLHSEAHDDNVKAMVEAASGGIDIGLRPEPALEGMGGTYFLSSPTGEPVAIFKPCDEEPLAPNNPKQWQGRAMGAPGMKPSVRVGEAALREVAAYALDHDGFAGVPAACLVECYHPVLSNKVKTPRIESMVDLLAVGDHDGDNDVCPADCSDVAVPASAVPTPAGGLSRALQDLCKLPAGAADAPKAVPGARKPGSLQAFVVHKCDANDMSPSHFSADSIHRIGIFDLRVLNCDRHAGNLLVRERARTDDGFARGGAPYELVPIDHGYALPEALDSPYFEWLFWPQSAVPFSDEVRRYVAALDADADVAMLRRTVPTLREECLRCLEVTTKVLQMCVAAGHTLYEIGCLFSRSEGSQVAGTPSDFEALCMDARDNVLANAHPRSSHVPGSGDSSPSIPDSPVSASAGLVSGGLTGLLLGRVDEASEVGSDDDGDVAIVGDDRDEGVLGNRGGNGHNGCDDDDDDIGCMFKMSRHGETSPAGLSPVPGASVELSPLLGPAPYLRPADAPAAPQSASGVDVNLAIWGRRGLTRARRNAWRTKHGGGAQMAAYPPLVPGTHPDKVNYVFSGLTAGQWRDFVRHVESFVSDEISAGTWRAAGGSSAPVGSCPMVFGSRMR